MCMRSLGFIYVAAMLTSAVGATYAVSQTSEDVPPAIASQDEGAESLESEIFEAERVDAELEPSSEIDLSPFPTPAQGMQQFVIRLDPKTDEDSFRLGLIAGRMMETDGVNKVHLGGRLEVKTVEGLGYDYYELSDPGPTMSTLMGVVPGRSPVASFVSVQEDIIRYNSRLPLVVYVPETFDVRYRIYEAGSQLSAVLQDANIGTPVTTAADDQAVAGEKRTVQLTVDGDMNLPAGAVASIRLYDRLLMDVDSTYGLSEVPVSEFPASFPLPDANDDGAVAGPGVSVSIRDKDGHLIYHTETSTPLNETGPTEVTLTKTR